MKLNNDKQFNNIDKLSSEYKLDTGNVKINWGKFLHCVSTIGFGTYVVYKGENITLKHAAIGLGIIGITRIISMGMESESKTKRK